MATKKNTAKTETSNSRNNSSAVKNQSSKASKAKTAKQTKAAKAEQPAAPAQQGAVINAYMLNRHIYNDGKIRCFKTQHGDYFKVFVYCDNLEGWDKYQFSQLFKDPNKALKYAFILKQKTGESINYDSFCLLMQEKQQAAVTSEDTVYHF